MAISSITTNYATRKKDIHIMQGMTVSGTSDITPSFGKISNFCTGVQKLVQRYAITLMTSLGSQENYPEFGTNLMINLNNRRLKLNRADVFALFNLANAKVIKEFRLYQASSDQPDDEMLNTAQLIDVKITNTGVYLHIKVIPVQATAVELILPLPKTT